VKEIHDKQMIENAANLALMKKFDEDKKQAQENEQEAYEKVKAMQNRMVEFKDTMDKILIKLSLIRNEILELRKKNEELMLENDRLSVRAAVGFENLTPRPDYKRLQGECEIDLEIFEGKRQIIPTATITQHIYKKISELSAKIGELNQSEMSGATRGDQPPARKMIRKKTTNLEKVPIPTNSKSSFAQKNFKLQRTSTLGDETLGVGDEEMSPTLSDKSITKVSS
jgi:hypothetical protein